MSSRIQYNRRSCTNSCIVAQVHIKARSGYGYSMRYCICNIVGIGYYKRYCIGAAHSIVMCRISLRRARSFIRNYRSITKIPCKVFACGAGNCYVPIAFKFNSVRVTSRSGLCKLKAGSNLFFLYLLLLYHARYSHLLPRLPNKWRVSLRLH